MEATTDPKAKGPKITISCEGGHETVLTVTSDLAAPVYLDSLCEMVQEMGNGLQGGCMWVDPETPDAERCGAKIDVSWAADPSDG